MGISLGSRMKHFVFVLKGQVLIWKHRITGQLYRTMTPKVRINFGVLLIIIVITFNHANAQDDHRFGYFEPGDTVLALGNDVNVRERPNIEGVVMGMVPIGTRMKILSREEDSHEVRGFSAPWYKVAFISPSSFNTGYVWGGLVTEGYDTLDYERDLLILYGLYASSKDDSGHIDTDIQVRLAENNSEILRTIVPGIGTPKTLNYCEVLDNRGLTGIENIILIHFYDDTNGGTYGKQVFFWDGEDLKHMFSLYDGSDAPYYSSQRLIFPDDRGGRPEQVILKSEVGYWDDEDGRDVIESRTYDIYRWDGKELLKK